MKARPTTVLAILTLLALILGLIVDAGLAQAQQGGIIEKEASIHMSNVMLVCPKCGKPSRTHVGKLTSGKKARVCNACDEMISNE